MMIDSIISIAFYISTVLTVLIWLLPSQYGQADASAQQAPKCKVQILVLGDIGRSPRMQYHALSIARKGGQVDIIGYNESEPHPDVSSHPNISIVPLPPHPAVLQTSNRILFLLYGPLKVLFQIGCLWVCLAYRTKPAKWLLVQNPPSIPSLAVASIVCFCRKTHLVIDWHNFGYSILALKLGPRHPLVRWSKWYEKTFCRYATAHLCVTRAMARVLKEDFALQAPILPLHDRPADLFQPIPDEKDRTRFLTSLPETEPIRAALEGSGNARVLVSSTSWTPDEDFSILLDALCQYSEIATSMAQKPEDSLPHIMAIITGKGPQREQYLKRIAELENAGKLEHATVRTTWLSMQDYARLLASASLGVSLHTSSSGVDLPMKVVDMFGAGLPVVGCQFEAWPELVHEGVNGRGFETATELADHLVDLFGHPDRLDTLRDGACIESTRRWDSEWDPVAGKLFGLVDSEVKID